MFIAYFTEQPDSSYPKQVGDDLGYTALLFPNKHFNAPAVADLYQQRLEEYLFVEEMGFDGIMLNEHHNAPFCLQPKCNIFAAVLAGMTKRVKLVLLGNPLPVSDNPVRIAEEIAEIDLISRGRVVSGFIRGGGTEQLSTNANPAYNRERFVEAHDLIIKTWTEPGPWRWEGQHYQLRVVNPWMLPLQKPHPRVWIPGVASRETVQFAAEHRYPFVALNTTMDATMRVWQTYEETARRVGYEVGPENRGYQIRVHVQDTQAKALECAREYLWMQGEFVGVTHPVWHSPAGYVSPRLRQAFVEVVNGRRPNVANLAGTSVESMVATDQLIAGTPDQVIKRLRHILETARPGILHLWGSDGNISHKDTLRCIELLGQEVLPALREIGKDLGLNSPFDVDAPVSLAHTPQEHRQPLAAVGGDYRRAPAEGPTC